jgi:4-amino-4-deoxy-L-arabinose transferase-like glycosyltransferase
MACTTVGLVSALWLLRAFVEGKPLWMLLRVTGEILFILVSLWLPGFSILTRFFNNHLGKRGIELLAIPATLAVYLALFVAVQTISAPVLIYQIVYFGLLTWSAGCTTVHLLRAKKKPHISRAQIFAALLAIFASTFICSGITGSPWKKMDSSIPAARASHGLPTDNSLQWQTAQVFISGGKPWAWQDGYWNWTMGDRPPLLAAVTAIYAKSYFSYRKFHYFDYTLLGVCLNALYVLPLVHLSRRLVNSERVALLASLSLALMPYFVVNTFYTWPKLFGLFFTATALSFFVSRAPDDAWTWTRPRAALLLGALLSLGALCHGGAALSIPFVLSVIVLSGRDLRPGRLFAGVSLSALAFGAVSLPWLVYKALHPSIQTQNLIYHYRAVADRPGNPVPLSTWLEQVPLQKQLEMRWGHVVQLLSQSEFRATVEAYLGGTLHAFYASRWPKEFFYPISQVDEVRWMAAGVAVCVLCVALVLAARTEYTSWPVTQLKTTNFGAVLIVLIAAAVSYALNVFAKWTEHTPHALPLAEIACTIVVLTLLAYGASRKLGHVVLGAVLLRFSHFAITTTLERGQPLFGAFGLGFLVSSALMIGLAFSAPDGPAEQATEPA